MWGIGIALSVALAVAVVGFAFLFLFLCFVKWVQSISEENKAEAEALDATAEDLEPGGVG